MCELFQNYLLFSQTIWVDLPPFQPVSRARLFHLPGTVLISRCYLCKVDEISIYISKLRTEPVPTSTRWYELFHNYLKCFQTVWGDLPPFQRVSRARLWHLPGTVLISSCYFCKIDHLFDLHFETTHIAWDNLNKMVRIVS